MEEIQIRTLRDRQKEKMQKAKDFFQKKEIDRIPEENELKKQSEIKKVLKSILILACMFVVGGIGGLYIDRIFIPNILIRYPDLNQYDLLKQVNERTTIVRETQEVKISQEDAISEAIEKVKPTVVQIFSKTSSGESTKTGSGIVLTSDGYILTALKNIEAESTETTQSTIKENKIEIKLANDNEKYPATVKSKSTEYKLAVLKIEKNNLPVIPYADPAELKLGQKLIVIDSAVVTDIISQFVDDYIPQTSTNSSFQSRIKIVQNLEATFAGAAVIDLEGSLVGMAEGEKIIIPFSEIEDFIDSSTK